MSKLALPLPSAKSGQGHAQAREGKTTIRTDIGIFRGILLHWLDGWKICGTSSRKEFVRELHEINIILLVAVLVYGILHFRP